ncbi:hypothetical protein [Cryobacterium sp. CG_9.6]|uniref:hypothetical protein n=1 Tax=Cryobacterium sp. CG_9.6 TaxID=2760710 RepID=UPI002474852B|nr:hypothetical protein [Cryobacterium sp. CG_9.6]MDH6237046.1 hypothetical protein [Cryobacterium sp. CG_9.6]
MTWTKLSDDFTDDCWTLSDAAARLHVEGLTWSNRKLLDLRIPKDDLHRFKTPQAIAELLSCGYWADAGNHYQIIHHADYQRLREAVIRQQSVNKVNRAQRGLKSAPPREQSGGPKFLPTVSNDSLHESMNDSTNEMDRTGRAVIREVLREEEELDEGIKTQVKEWPVTPIPTSDPDKSDHEKCLVCSNSLYSSDGRSSGLCKKGDADHTRARDERAA